MTRISDLVLEDLAVDRARRRRCSLGQLQSDIRLLIGGDSRPPNISVTDNGTGMSEQQVSSILEGNITSTKPCGHGFGMRFALRECAENGFRLSLESTLGEGSRFVNHIPRDDQAEESPFPLGA